MKKIVSGIAVFVVSVVIIFFFRILYMDQNKRELQKYLELFYEEKEIEILMENVRVNNVEGSSTNYQVSVKGGYYIDNGTELIIVIKSKNNNPIDEEKINCFINEERNIDEGGVTYLIEQKFATDSENCIVLKYRFVSAEKVQMKSVNIEIDSEIVTMNIPSEKRAKKMHYIPIENDSRSNVQDVYLSPFSLMYYSQENDANNFEQITIKYTNGQEKSIGINNGFVSMYDINENKYIFLRFLDKVSEMKQIEYVIVGDVMYKSKGE